MTDIMKKINKEGKDMYSPGRDEGAIGGGRGIEGEGQSGGTRFMMTGTVEGGELKIDFRQC